MSVSKVSKDDFVKIEYSAKASDGRLVDSTKEKPLLTVAGKNLVIPGLDEAIVGAEKGVEKTVEVPKDKGFGERDARLVKLVPLQRFREQGIDPAPGLVVELDGRRARVQSVSGGRVRVDFNHELAGLDLKYVFKVVEVFKNAEDKLKALVEDALGIKTTVLSAGVARISVAPAVKKDAEFIVKKMRVIGYALEFIPEVKKVVFEEEYEKQGKQGESRNI